MRIVGGELRGRTLAAPKSNDIRPTIAITQAHLQMPELKDAMEAGRAVQERAQSGVADVKDQGRAGAEDVSGEADGWA